MIVRENRRSYVPLAAVGPFGGGRGAGDDDGGLVRLFFTVPISFIFFNTSPISGIIQSTFPDLASSATFRRATASSVGIPFSDDCNKCRNVCKITVRHDGDLAFIRITKSDIFSFLLIRQ